MYLKKKKLEIKVNMTAFLSAMRFKGKEEDRKTYQYIGFINSEGHTFPIQPLLLPKSTSN